jgi:hypothetical protein
LPILVAAPVVVEPPSVINIDLVDTRTLAFRDLDGNYPFLFERSEFFFQSGLEGIDRSPVEVIREPQPGMHGSRLREIRYPERSDVFLPLFLRGATHAEYMDRRDLLDRLFAFEGVDYASEDGTFDLVANSSRGERSLRLAYLEGLEGGMHPIEGVAHIATGIRAVACRPHWYGGQWETRIIRQTDSQAWFGHFPGRLTSSRALGDDILVAVPGDVASWPTVELVGPADTVTITAPGLSVSIPAGLASGEAARIVTDPRGRTALFDGVKDWSRIAPSDRYAPLPPGDQLIDIVVTGATAVTTAQVVGDILWRRPW